MGCGAVGCVGGHDRLDRRRRRRRDAIPSIRNVGGGIRTVPVAFDVEVVRRDVRRDRHRRRRPERRSWDSSDEELFSYMSRHPPPREEGRCECLCSLEDPRDDDVVVVIVVVIDIDIDDDDEYVQDEDDARRRERIARTGRIGRDFPPPAVVFVVDDDDVVVRAFVDDIAGDQVRIRRLSDKRGHVPLQ